MEHTDAVKCLAALAQGTRLEIFRALVVAGPSGVTPGQLSEQLNLPAATLSFHLKELNQSGLILQRRESRNLIYTTNYPQMNQLMAYLTENCCAGQDCLVSNSNSCEC